MATAFGPKILPAQCVLLFLSFFSFSLMAQRHPGESLLSQSLLGFFFFPPPPPRVLHSGWGLSQGRRLEGEESSMCLAQLGLCAVEGGKVSSRPPLRPRRAVQSSQKPPLRRTGEGTLPDFPEAHTCAPHGVAQGFTTAGKEGNSHHTWRPRPWAETDSPLDRLAIWPDSRHPAGPGLGREESLRAGLWPSSGDKDARPERPLGALFRLQPVTSCTRL